MNRLLQGSFFLDYVQSRMVVAVPEVDLDVEERTTKHLTRPLIPTPTAVVSESVTPVEASETSVPEVVTDETEAPATSVAGKSKKSKKASKKRPGVSKEPRPFGGEDVTVAAKSTKKAKVKVVE